MTYIHGAASPFGGGGGRAPKPAAKPKAKPAAKPKPKASVKAKPAARPKPVKPASKPKAARPAASAPARASSGQRPRLTNARGWDREGVSAKGRSFQIGEAVRRVWTAAMAKKHGALKESVRRGVVVDLIGGQDNSGRPKPGALVWFDSDMEDGEAWLLPWLYEEIEHDPDPPPRGRKVDWNRADALLERYWRHR